MDVHTQYPPRSPAGESNGGGDGDGEQDRPAPADEVRSAFSHFGELADYANHYFAARLDAIKLTLRNVAIFAALGIVGLIAGGALVVTAVVQLCMGLAQAVAALLGGRMWAGNLIVGVLLLGLLAGGVMIGLKLLAKGSKKKTVAKYELRQSHQRNQYGRDAADRAAAAGKVDL